MKNLGKVLVDHKWVGSNVEGNITYAVKTSSNIRFFTAEHHKFVTQLGLK